jgi:RimJ/RimL family protein N-acetyltransferase
MIPLDLSLQNNNVLLRPVVSSDEPEFLKLAQDEDTWTYFSLNLGDEVQLKRWMNLAFLEVQQNTRRAFTIVDKSSGKIAGSTSMGNISLNDLRLEIGWSWLAPAYRSSGLNRQCKFMIMQYAFDQLDFERVEFKTDVLNKRARKGLEKVGGTAEGVLRSHMTMWNNRRRDSIYYSVLKNEWPVLKQTIFADLISI